MYHIVQENCFKEPHYNKLIESLIRLDLPYEIIKLKPFIEDIEYTTDRKDVMVWGAIKLARLAKEKDWNPGSFMSDKHDYDYYSKYFKDSLFNNDSKIIKYSDKDVELPELFFARPTKDSKAFTGKVMDKYEFEFMRSTLKKNNWVKEDFNIQIAPVKKVFSESRFWVVDGKVITGSYYRRGGKYYLEEISDYHHLFKYAQHKVDEHQIAEAFVIDICESEGRLSIMEFGCINCAGFYLGDMQKVVMALENKFN